MKHNLIGLAQSMRYLAHTIREAVIEADGLNAPAAEQASLILADIDVLETMLRERRKALRREIREAQEARVKA